MKVEQGQAALLTGGASGIGRALALGLARRGVKLSILDVDVAGGEETVRLVEEEHAKISYKPQNPPTSAIFIPCDVADTNQLAGAFGRHHDVFGQLQICVNNAGTCSLTPFYEDDSWRKTIDVNLSAVIDGSAKAIRAMKEGGGLILNVASSGAFMPNNMFPVYGASKSGVAMFTRCLSKLGMGIRVNALCPELVDTKIVSVLPPGFKEYYAENMGFIDMDTLVKAAFSLFDDESMAGECLWISCTRPIQIWPDEETKRKELPLKKDGTPFAE